jgi:phosphotransferase system HPr-like phosphotransfer protein
MFEKKIQFNAVNEIKEFVNLTTRQPFDIDLIAGRYVADAKSILSVFGLDLGSEVTLGIHATQEEAQEYLRQIEKFLV